VLCYGGKWSGELVVLVFKVVIGPGPAELTLI
jgi:hypothetical protein